MPPRERCLGDRGIPRLPQRLSSYLYVLPRPSFFVFVPVWSVVVVGQDPRPAVFVLLDRRREHLAPDFLLPRFFFASVLVRLQFVPRPRRPAGLALVR